MKKTRLFAALLCLALLAAMLPHTALAADISGAVSASVTWNDGDVIASAVTITGGTESAPVVVTVNGTVKVKAAVTVSSGYVQFTGGGRLLRDTTFVDNNMLNVSSANITLEDITIDGGSVSGSGFGLDISGTSNVFINEGTVICNHLRSAAKGNALRVNSGTVHITMNGGEIKNNSQLSYGAIYLDNGSDRDRDACTFTMNGGSVTGNACTGETITFGGGAFYLRYATLTVNGGTISDNSVSPKSGKGRGGAIYCSSYGKLVLNGGVIRDNTAPIGSGVFFSSQTNANAEMYIGGDALISNNVIYLDNSGAEKYPYITSPIKNPLPLVTEAFSEDLVLAVGTAVYTLTEADMTKVSIATSDDTPYFAKLDSANNQLLMTETDPGYTVYHNVSYYGNGGTGSVSDDNNYEDGQAVTVKANGFSRTGYGFTGWNTAANGGGTAYAPGDSFNITADTALYAQWQEEQPPVADTLYYNATDGKLHMGSTDGAVVEPTVRNIGSNGTVPVYSGSGNTLTLSGVRFTTTVLNALVLPADMTLTLAEGTANTISVGTAASTVGFNQTNNSSKVIYSAGALTINGSGTLNAESYTIFNQPDTNGSCIEAAGSCTINAKVNIVGGNATNFYGVKADSITVNSGTVDISFEEDSLHTQPCYGIHAGNNITILGGSVSAITRNVSKGYGIYSGGSMTISGGIVTAAGNSVGNGAYGIAALYALKITGGHITASETHAGSAPGVAAVYGNPLTVGSTAKPLTITGATEATTGSGATITGQRLTQSGTDPVVIFEANGVTHVLTNLTATAGTAGAGKAIYGAEYATTLSAEANYTLPTAITVKVGENTLTAGTDYTYSNTGVHAGKVTIPAENVTGAITLTASGVADSYTVPLDQQGGTGGTDSVTATFGSDMPAVTPPTRQNYAFLGYFDKTTDGTQYYNADGTSAKAWDKTEAATLYAQWVAVPAVTSVTVSPATASVLQGGSMTFTAVVNGTNSPAQTVTWDVEGETSASTTINTSGALSVGSDETAATLTVRATSTADTSKSGTATVTVTAKTYTVAVTPETYDFGTKSKNYWFRPAEHTYTVKNEGNSDVMLGALTGSTAFAIATPADWGTALAPNATRTFTVQPNSGLDTGTYDETFTVSTTQGTSDTFQAKFVVGTQMNVNITGDPGLSIIVGQSTDLTANVTGGTAGASYTYKWTIPATSTTLLETTNSVTVSPTASTTYQVEVTEVNNSRNTATATVTVTAAPVDPPASNNSISGITAGQVYTQGDTVSFTAVGGGMDNTVPNDGDMRWQPTAWATNPDGTWSDAPYTASFSTTSMTLGDHTLTVTFTKQQRSGGAWANISPAVTDQKSVSFTLVAADIAPAVNPPDTVPDRTVPAVIGSAATLSITASGTEPMTFQWYRSVNGGAFSPIADATGRSYTTSPVTAAQNGYRYYCIVTNGAGSEQSGVFLLHATDIPATGDRGMPGLWLGLALVTGTALAGSAVLRRRKRNAENG